MRRAIAHPVMHPPPFHHPRYVYILYVVDIQLTKKEQTDSVIMWFYCYATIMYAISICIIVEDYDVCGIVHVHIQFKY